MVGGTTSSSSSLPTAPQRKPRIKIRSRDSSLQGRGRPTAHVQPTRGEERERRRPASVAAANRDPQGFLRRMQDLVREAEMVDGEDSSQPVWPATAALDQPPPLSPVSASTGRVGGVGRTYG